MGVASLTRSSIPLLGPVRPGTTGLGEAVAQGVPVATRPQQLHSQPARSIRHLVLSSCGVWLRCSVWVCVPPARSLSFSLGTSRSSSWKTPEVIFQLPPHPRPGDTDFSTPPTHRVQWATSHLVTCFCVVYLWISLPWPHSALTLHLPHISQRSS